MATKVRKHTDQKKIVRFKRKRRIRARISGDAAMPRLTVFKSNAHLYASLINDEQGQTIISVSTLEKLNRGKLKNTLEGAKALGAMIAQRAIEKQIKQVVFDRAGYLYHGKIKALADSARENGLKF